MSKCISSKSARAFTKTIIKLPACLYKSFKSFNIIYGVYIPCLSFMCDIHRQVQSITVTFNSLELMTCHFYLVLMSFLFVFIPDLSFLHSDIANYFKLSGRQLQFHLNLILAADLGVENSVALSALNSSSGSYGCHFRFKFNLSSTSVNTQRDRSVVSICIAVTHLMW